MFLQPVYLIKTFISGVGFCVMEVQNPTHLETVVTCLHLLSADFDFFFFEISTNISLVCVSLRYADGNQKKKEKKRFIYHSASALF